MKIQIIGSGSRGNAYALTSSSGQIILLDFGVKWQSILRAIDYRVTDVQAALLTHEHGDHLLSLRHVVSAGIDIYTNSGTFNFIKEKYGEYVYTLREKCRYKFGEFTVMPWLVPHTSRAADGTLVPCMNYAYLIEHPEMGKLAYMTDLEYSPVSLKSQSIEHLLCEVNYTDDDADRDSVTYEHRIMGHMAFSTFKEKILRENISPRLRTVIVCHLSYTAADRVRILRETEALVGPTVDVFIADPGLEVGLGKEPF